MARDPELVGRVRAALSMVDDVGEKRMFGSTAFMVRGKLAIAARPDRLMCRIDPTLQEAALKRGGCRIVVMRGRQMRGYLHVDAASVGTARALKDWIDRVLTYNETLVQGSAADG